MTGDDTKKKYKIYFSYLSLTGIADQSFYSYETNESSESKALEVLKSILKDGLQIRVDRVIDLSPKYSLTNSERIKEKFENKSNLQKIILIIGGCLIVMSAISKIFNRMSN